MSDIVERLKSKAGNGDCGYCTNALEAANRIAQLERDLAQAIAERDAAHNAAIGSEAYNKVRELVKRTNSLFGNHRMTFTQVTDEILKVLGLKP
jgi:hypothetical protein